MRMNASDVIEHQRRHGFIQATAALTLPLILETPQRIDFFMEFDPPTATAQHKGARIVVPNDPAQKPFISWFTKKETVEAEKTIARHLAPFRPVAPFQGPLRIVTEWTFPWRTTEPKKNRVDGWKWKDTSSDADNLLKTMLDVLQSEGFYGNDSQIADLRVTKMWGDRPGIRVTMEALEPQPPRPEPSPVPTLRRKYPVIPKPANDEGPPPF